METLLRVRDLSVHFRSDGGGDVSALEGVSFEIAAGEAVGMLGESGCGKTTAALSLLRLLPASARVTRGSVQLQNLELLTLPEDRLNEIRGAEISVVFQEPEISLNPVRRVGRQVMDVIQAHRPWSQRRCREEAEEALARVGLSPAGRFAGAYAHELSAGERQRVSIALALSCRPRLVIADEPTSSLDSTHQAEILALLKEAKERLGLALLFISHDPGCLAMLADRVLVMYAGRIVEEGSLATVFRRPLHPYTRGLLAGAPRRPGSAPSPDQGRRLPAIPGSPPDPTSPPTGCPFEPRCAERLEICSVREPEEVRPETSRRVRCFLHGG